MGNLRATLDLLLALHMPLGPTVANTLGAAFIGHIVSVLLTALTWAQAVTYFTTPKEDTLLLKVVVVVVCLMGAAQMAFVTEAMYTYIVEYGSNLAVISTHSQWGLSAQIFVTEFSSILVRSVFIHRIWRLSRHRLKHVFGIFLMILSAYIFVTSCIIGTAGFVDYKWEITTNFSGLIWGTFAVEVGTDAIIAACMSWLLWRLRTGIHSSDSIVQRFVAYSVYTGVLTTICATVIVICYLIVPETYLQLAFDFIFGKLYAISLLGSLNARMLLLRHENNTEQTTDLLSTNVPMLDASRRTRLTDEEQPDATSDPLQEHDGIVMEERKSFTGVVVSHLHV